MDGEFEGEFDLHNHQDKLKIKQQYQDDINEEEEEDDDEDVIQKSASYK